MSGAWSGLYGRGGKRDVARMHSILPHSDALDGIADAALFGAASAAPISGEASIVEADDTLSSTAAVLVSGAASITEADDTLSATSTVAVKATLSITESNDTLSATIGDVAATADNIRAFVRPLARSLTRPLARSVDRATAA